MKKEKNKKFSKKVLTVLKLYVIIKKKKKERSNKWQYQEK